MAAFTVDELAWFKGPLREGPHGECRVVVAYPSSIRVTYEEQTMPEAIEVFDPFNHEVYWPLKNVGCYLGRMGL